MLKGGVIIATSQCLATIGQGFLITRCEKFFKEAWRQPILFAYNRLGPLRGRRRFSRGRYRRVSGRLGRLAKKFSQFPKREIRGVEQSRARNTEGEPRSLRSDRKLRSARSHRDRPT